MARRNSRVNRSEGQKEPSNFRWDIIAAIGAGIAYLWAKGQGGQEKPNSMSPSSSKAPMASGEGLAADSDAVLDLLEAGAVSLGAYGLLSMPLPESLTAPRPPSIVPDPEPKNESDPAPTTVESTTFDLPGLDSISARTDAPLGLEVPDKPNWTPPSDAMWLDLVPHPSVVLIIGKRGSGKSALGYRILELMRGRGEPYVVGLPAKAHKLLPDWVGSMERLEDVPSKAVVLIDESYLQYHSRAGMAGDGRDIGGLINLSRQRQQTLVFIVQEARQLDVNIVSQMDVLAVKDLSDLSKGFERPQLRALTDKARAAFVAVEKNTRQWTWVYSERADHEGLVPNELASFWTTRLSRAFAQPSGEGAPLRRGKQPQREELVAKVTQMHKAGLSYSQIGDVLGISKTKAWRLDQDGPGGR